MSSMLEQAIIDAEALKEAAVKTAEQTILEKYSADIKNATIKAEDAQIFVSAETAATGSAQNVAHGLTGTPSKVFVTLTEFGGSTACDVALGTHTSTNCVVTITAGVKFQVWAMI